MYSVIGSEYDWVTMNLRGPRSHLVPRDLPLVAGISAECGAEIHGPHSTPSVA